ncbi:MAG: Rieske (2Fe-2S) protein [Planctomycetaceae bacterium]|nr:Rieske (2Fe-2S) protein [Planctomycetaceae bacterium]
MPQSPHVHGENKAPLAEFLNATEPRRDFMTQAAAIAIGGLVGVLPAAVGLATFLNPLRKSVKAQQAPTGSDAEGYFKVARLDALSEVPQAFKIIADRKDAWNTYPQEAIGAVFLQRLAGDEIRAFNVSCPHAGCSVDFRSGQQSYHCPCHNSAFTVDGTRNRQSPSPRDLDALFYKVVDGEVLVKFQNFKAGVKEKKRV